MEDFRIVPPLIVKDTPKLRRLNTLGEARDYVGEAMRIGRPEPWREVWHRLKSVTSDSHRTPQHIGASFPWIARTPYVLESSGRRRRKFQHADGEGLGS